MADDDEVLRCKYCSQTQPLPMVFDPIICEACMTVYADTGVWLTP